MVRFVGVDPAEAQRRLEEVGIEVLPVGAEGSRTEANAVESVLAAGERQVRGIFDAEPPEPGLEHEAHCAWHTNAVTEAHTITSGLGLFQFWTPGGPVTVITEPGDLLVNRGAEHRFLPVRHQRLVLRHSGEADADFGYVATDRTPDPWPEAT